MGCEESVRGMGLSRLRMILPHRRIERARGNRPLKFSDGGQLTLAGGMIPIMAENRTQQATPGLFSTAPVAETSPLATKPVASAVPERRHILPKDLPSAIKHLTDQVSLTRGQINAVRAAFKAGIKPSLIARQFAISQADVRNVLASDTAARRA
jgi:hypothetical protein